MSKITQLMSLIDFPGQARDFFEKVYKDVESAGLLRQLDDLRELYFLKFNCQELEDGLEVLAKKTDFHRYTVDMLFLLYSAVMLEEKYIEKGYTREFFAHNMKDLSYKAEECKKLHGFYGSMRYIWYEGFFKLERFALGRLQYEQSALLFDWKDLKKGDAVINIHIPSSGPLLANEVEESFNLACDFFGPNYSDELVLMCNTWMLYPKTAALYGENSNLRKFYDMFEIIGESEDVHDSQKWRIFYTQTDDLEELPRETSLQRTFYDYFKNGGHMGVGFGMLSYKPTQRNGE